MEILTTGERILIYRKRKDLTREQLAERCGLTADEILKYEYDQAIPSANNISVLANELGVSVDQLLYGF